MNKALSAIEAILQWPLFKNGDYKKYPEQQINRSRSYEWYKKVKQEKGEAAAEEIIKLQSEHNHIREFSGFVHPLLLAIRAFLKVCKEAESVVFIDDVSKTTYPCSYHIEKKRAKMIVLFSPESHGCGCSDRPPGSGVWSRNGTLGLQTVAVVFDDLFNITADLVFDPKRRRGSGESSGQEVYLDGYDILSFDLNGEVSSSGGYIFAKKYGYLRSSLGLYSKELLLNAGCRSGGGVEDLFFPGAIDYIAKHIAELPAYLDHIAKELSGNKKK